MFETHHRPDAFRLLVSAHHPDTERAARYRDQPETTRMIQFGCAVVVGTAG
jgi:hypothetical protein